MSIAISVQGLAKSYTIRHNAPDHVTLAEAALARLKNPFRRPTRETFWALNDISFDVQEGDVVGVIGRNGAGKSTLLKILSRITEPTRGQIDLFGRVGSLLEVGTGFHPELTGRENIFLNGAILGMRKSEIRKQFDAIVDFAGVEKFLDTPVKRYSSGMYVRLAFAVAAHLSSEILIVDEVLSVGDSEFQNKCLGKMQDVSKSGRTVLFVSHNMASVAGLCNKAIFLERGNVAGSGPVRTAIDSYLRAANPQAADRITIRKDVARSGTGALRITEFRLENDHGKTIRSALSGMALQFVFNCENPDSRPVPKVDIGMSFTSYTGQLLSVFYGSYQSRTFTAGAGVSEFRCSVGRLPLAAGRYAVHARIVVAGTEADFPRDPVAQLDVEAGDFYGTGSRGFEGDAPLLLEAQWSQTQPNTGSAI